MRYEVRFHGRGGQGAVMGAQALAVAADHDGYYATAFPFFGAERRGAPVLAFTRFGEEPLRGRTQVRSPDAVVVLDLGLAETVDVLHGLSTDGTAVVNSRLPPGEVSLSREAKTATVDATSISIELTGRAAVNMTMLGAYAKVLGTPSLIGVEVGIREVLGRRLGAEVVQRNVDAARAAYDATREGLSKGNREYSTVGRWLPDVTELPPGLATSAMDTPYGPVGPGSSVSNRTGGWRVSRPVLDASKCTNCLLCWFCCPDGSIIRGEQAVDISLDYCKGCGVCADVCAPGAIDMELEVQGVSA